MDIGHRFAQHHATVHHASMRLTVCLACLLFVGAVGCSEQPARKTWAVVVSIAPNTNPKWNPDKIVVTARSQDGAMGSKAVELNRLGCRIGNTIPATSRGIALTLDEHACQR